MAQPNGYKSLLGGAPVDDPDHGCISISTLRTAIRDEQKLSLVYRDENDNETCRIVRPFALSYRSSCVLLAGWCELRAGLRHFRTDRIYGCEQLEERFVGEGEILRGLWLQNNQLVREDDTIGDFVNQADPREE